MAHWCDKSHLLSSSTKSVDDHYAMIGWQVLWQVAFAMGLTLGANYDRLATKFTGTVCSMFKSNALNYTIYAFSLNSVHAFAFSWSVIDWSLHHCLCMGYPNIQCCTFTWVQPTFILCFEHVFFQCKSFFLAFNPHRQGGGLLSHSQVECQIFISYGFSPPTT